MTGPRLAIIPAAAIEDRRLTPLALRALLFLGKHANTKSGWCRVKQKRMAEALGCARSTVQLALGQLLDVGYIEVRLSGRPGVADPDPNKQPYASHSYRVRFEVNGVATDDGVEVEGDVAEVPDESGTGCPVNQAPGADPIASAPLERLSGNVSVVESTRAGGKIRPEAVIIADEISVLCGIDPGHPPPGWCGAALRVEAWLSQGWSRDAIVVGVNTTLASRRNTEPPFTINYFEKAIRRVVADQNLPLQEQKQESCYAETQSTVSNAVRRNLANGISIGPRPTGIFDLNGERRKT